MQIRWDSPLRLIFSLFTALRIFLSGRPVLTSKEDADKRISLCKLCPNYHEGQCKVCTCFVEVKAYLAHEKCPRGYWEYLNTRS